MGIELNKVDRRDISSARQFPILLVNDVMDKLPLVKTSHEHVDTDSPNQHHHAKTQHSWKLLAILPPTGILYAKSQNSVIQHFWFLAAYSA
jgi:hypothetical protein